MLGAAVRDAARRPGCLVLEPHTSVLYTEQRFEKEGSLS